jgi:hypothetical protein
MLENVQQSGGFIVTILLCVLILLSFIKLMFVGTLYKNVNVNIFKLAQQDLVRLIGACIVFLIAIIASNPWIYFVSFFIGGLLVASERFMILLAGVLSSDRKNVYKIIEHANELSRDEVAERVEIEARELVQSEIDRDEKDTELNKSEESNDGIEDEVSTLDKPVPIIRSNNIKETDVKLDKARSSVQLFEQAVYKKIEDIFFLSTQVIKQNVRLIGKNGAARVYDVAVLSEENLLYATAEMKYIGRMSLGQVKRIMDKAEVESPANDVKKIYIFGFNNYDYNVTNELLEYRKKMKLWDSSIGLVYFNVLEGDSGKYELDPINVSDLNMLKDNEKDIF